MKNELEQAFNWWHPKNHIEKVNLVEKHLNLKVDGKEIDKNISILDIIKIWDKETQEHEDLPDNMDAGDLMYGKEEYNETFNPEAHSSLIIDFDKVETIEEIAQRHSDENHIIGDFYKLGFIEGVKWCKEQLKN